MSNSPQRLDWIPGSTGFLVQQDYMPALRRRINVHDDYSPYQARVFCHIAAQVRQYGCLSTLHTGFVLKRPNLISK